MESPLDHAGALVNACGCLCVYIWRRSARQGSYWSRVESGGYSWCRVSVGRRQTIVVSASVRVVCIIIRLLYFSCDLLVVLLSFSLLQIHFYFDKRVDFRSILFNQDSFPIGVIRTLHQLNYMVLVPESSWMGITDIITFIASTKR